jgi:hypothetical protein
LRQAKLAVDPSSFGVLQIHQEKNIWFLQLVVHGFFPVAGE